MQLVQNNIASTLFKQLSLVELFFMRHAIAGFVFDKPMAMLGKKPIFTTTWWNE